MKHLIWALLFLGHVSSAAAQFDGYTLDTAPWSNQEFELCPILNDSGFQAVVFKPKIKEWSYTQEGPLKVKLKATEKGITEIVVKAEKRLKAYHLIEQKIGYLDDKKKWVDKNGSKVSNFDSFEILSGEKVKPNIKGLSSEEYIYLSNLERESAAAMEKIHYAAPCTVFVLEHYDLLEADFLYDFGKNNPYECGQEKSIKRSQKFNYTAKISRPVVSRPDGSQYYIKLPTGEIIIHGWTGAEHLYNKDGSLICEWNDLGSIIGYELTQENE